MSEWKPGDVAMVRSMYDTEVVGVRTGVPSNMGWAYSMELTDGPGSGGSVSTSTQSWSSDPYGTRVIRPLVVIDVEDDEQIDRLAGAMDAAIADPSLRKSPEMVRAALREFANPKPPKPEEPTGLGAVVRTVHDELYVRDKTTTTVAHWKRARGEERGCRHRWDDLHVVEVLSEGVAS